MLAEELEDGPFETEAIGFVFDVCQHPEGAASCGFDPETRQSRFE
jgi:hypothetical protein